MATFLIIVGIASIPGILWGLYLLKVTSKPVSRPARITPIQHDQQLIDEYCNVLKELQPKDAVAFLKKTLPILHTQLLTDKAKSELLKMVLEIDNWVKGKKAP